MLFAGGGTYNKDTHLCGILSLGVDCLISNTHFGDGSAYNLDMLIAGGSAINGSEPTLFMGLFNFSAADPITRANWDVGSALCWWRCQ